MHAFYLQESEWINKRLVDIEFKHATQVLRLKTMDEFLLFDGNGTKAHCKIVEIQKKYLTFEIINKEVLEKSTSSVILAAAWTKAARRGFLFEKVVELEATELWIWHAEYSQFPIPDENSATVQSWQAQLIAGIKQCHNPFLPKLRLFSSQKEMLSEAVKHNYLHVLTTDEANSISNYTTQELNKEGSTVLTIGPEGGFSPKETAIFEEHKAKFYTLGDRILRYETAAILALGLHFWYKVGKQSTH